MIAGGNATLYVTDIKRAVRFYVETLGFKLRARREDKWAEIDAGEGLVLGLHPITEQTPKDGRSAHIGLHVMRPIEEVVAVLDNRGVSFPRGVIDGGAVKLAHFADPDGNVLYLYEPVRP